MWLAQDDGITVILRMPAIGGTPKCLVQLVVWSPWIGQQGYPFDSSGHNL